MIAREREFNERVVEWEKSREALLDEQKKQMSVKEEEIRALEERLKEVWNICISIMPVSV